MSKINYNDNKVAMNKGIGLIYYQESTKTEGTAEKVKALRRAA